jgi:UDP-N-acetylmuramoylalanine--D-glutamate ligase
MRDWSAGEVAVIGLGKSGVAACAVLARQGARVYASDASDSAGVRASAERARATGADAQSGSHDLERIAAARVVVVSPGVPPDAPPRLRARAAGVEIVSEVELALSVIPDLQYIAVTGTNGKSTVTALIAHLLESLGVDAVAAGNIGLPLSEVVLRDRRPAWVALELSSFQLHDTPSLRPAVGVLTNLAPDHLDRYPNVESYYADKALLFRHAAPASRWVVNADDPASLAMVEGVPGAMFRFSVAGRFGDAFFDRQHRKLIVEDEPLLSRPDFPLLGDHNVANALAASLAVFVAAPAFGSIDAHRRVGAALRTFHSLPHRREPIGEFDDVLWINDSKATNVSSALVAVASMTRPTILLLGGRHKNEPYTSLLPAIATHCRAVLAYGEAANVIMQDLGGQAPVQRVDGPFSDVMARARALAQPGDAILLAPACSSYDMFTNYEERGRTFAAAARGAQS